MLDGLGLASARVLAIAGLVLLAGCGVPGLGGGGDSGGTTPTAPTQPDSGLLGTTSTPTRTPTPTGTPTPSPTPQATQAPAIDPSSAPSPTPTGTPTPSPTPLPPAAETVTVSNESLGLSMRLVGQPAALDTRIGNLTDAFDGRLIACARLSPIVGVTSAGRVADVTVRQAYDPTGGPASASERELVIFAYNTTVERFIPLNGTVNRKNDSVRATEIDGSRNSFVNGMARLEITLDGARLDSAFVVLHEPTVRAGIDGGPLPAACPGESHDPTPGTASAPTGRLASGPRGHPA